MMSAKNRASFSKVTSAAANAKTPLKADGPKVERVAAIGIRRCSSRADVKTIAVLA
jgi:hypothetical protein